MSAPLHVVGAAIVDGDRCLVARRGPAQSQAGKWEFPGGKVEPGESPAEALRRELREELGLTVEVGAWIGRGAGAAGDRTVHLDVYLARHTGGELRPTEHDKLEWLGAESLPQLDWAEADVPIVAALARHLQMGELPRAAVDFDTYFEALEAAGRHVHILRAHPNDAGWEHFVLEVNGEWIFRFPRDLEARERLTRELRLLPWLATALRLPVPAVEIVGTPAGETLPRYVGYRRIPGRPIQARDLEVATIRQELGECLARLHGARIDGDAPFAPFTRENWWRTYTDLREVIVTDRLPEELGAAAAAALAAHLDALLDRIACHRFTPVPVHRDLGPEHLLCSEEGTKIEGILDWSDAALDDPALDFAGLLGIAAEPAVLRLAEHYDAPWEPGLLERARTLRDLAPFWFCADALELGHPEKAAARARRLLAERAGQRAD